MNPYLELCIPLVIPTFTCPLSFSSSCYLEALMHLYNEVPIPSEKRDSRIKAPSDHGDSVANVGLRGNLFERKVLIDEYVSKF